MNRLNIEIILNVFDRSITPPQLALALGKQVYVTVDCNELLDRGRLSVHAPRKARRDVSKDKCYVHCDQTPSTFSMVAAERKFDGSLHIR